ncbi:hypothetical protein GUJ93_ZPchr0007g3025 [Zizania palustris]|uniref:Uncharacterized protein n=1 Tax=Zizania palustris TaxID=103762 RepID=A0A8J5VS02_ZIZPA|nr:hypothetical protein GUJ93_ZPchr0007g3025 [Zizania palustris]
MIRSPPSPPLEGASPAARHYHPMGEGASPPDVIPLLPPSTPSYRRRSPRLKLDIADATLLKPSPPSEDLVGRSH